MSSNNGIVRLNGDGSTKSSANWVRAAVSDGTVALTAGSGIAIGSGVRLVTSLTTNEAGLWWLVACLLLGLAIVVFGGWLRERARRRRVHVGLVVGASPRGSVSTRQFEQAEKHSGKTCAVTLKESIELPGDGNAHQELVKELADATLSTITMAEQLIPDAVHIDLFPIMPAHVAFSFGARLGNGHVQEVMVYAPQKGSPGYFPATSLRPAESDEEPLLKKPTELLNKDSLAAVALAVDLEGRGDDFFDHVSTACEKHGFGLLHRLGASSAGLVETQGTFTAAVEQAVKVWQDARWDRSPHPRRYAVFLNGPAAVAVALGARLAASEYSQWTIFGFDAGVNRFEPFPAVPPGDGRIR